MSVSKLYIYALIFFICPVFFTWANNAHIYFTQDSARIGEEIKLHLTIRYFDSYKIIVPDSTFDYGTLEFIKKEYGSSYKGGPEIIDSITYTLSTFQLQNIQTIDFPIYFIRNADTQVVYTNTDTIFLKRNIQTSTEDYLQDYQSLQTLEQKYNYPKLLLYILSIIILIVLLYNVFGKYLVRRYRLFILNRSHSRFSSEFDKLTFRVSTQRNVTTVQELLIHWKTYISKLDEHSLLALTTTELIELYQNNSLQNTLVALDQSIYGNKIGDLDTSILIELKKFSQHRYQRKRRSILVE
ncbi:MAG: hypothetical protein U0U66_01735 [Cytophagaceae bacterium]